MSNLNGQQNPRDANCPDEHSQSKPNKQSGSVSENKNKPVECDTQSDLVLLKNVHTMAKSPDIERCSDQSGSNYQSSDRRVNDISRYRAWMWELFLGIRYILRGVANQLFMLVVGFQPQHLPLGFVQKVTETSARAQVSKATDTTDSVPCTKPSEKVSITAGDQVTIIGGVIKHAYHCGQYDTVSAVLNTLPGKVAVEVLQYLPVFGVRRLLAWAVDVGDISCILTLLLRAYDNRTQCIQSEELIEIMSIVDVNAINRIVCYDCDVNTMNAHGRSLLWYASYIGQFDMVSALTQAHADVSVRDKKCVTALYIASQKGHGKVVRLLLDHQAAVNQTRSDDGASPLFIASCNGHSEVVKLLLDHQAAMNQSNCNGLTPLFIASCNGHSKVVNLLLDHQAAVNQSNCEGVTPLYIASEKGHTEVVRLLLGHQAAVNQASSDDGASPLFMASEKGHGKVVQMLLGHQAAVNQARSDGFTPLFIASCNGHSEVVHQLLDHQAAVNQARSDGFTPLFIASCNGHSKVVQLLLNQHAAVNQADCDGCTPLFIASQKGHTAVVKLLLNHQVAVNQAWNTRGTPLFIASQKGHSKVVQLLLDHRAAVNQTMSDGVTPLCIASGMGHIKVVRLLLDQHAAVNQPDCDGVSPLFIASEKGHDQVVRLLLDYQAAVNQTTIDGRIPLYSACATGQEHIVITLLKRGANVNAVTDSGQSPLSSACFYGHLNIVTILIKHNANIYHQSMYSVTPFFLACVACHYDVVEYLLQYENIVQKAFLGHSPLHASIFLNEEEVELYLKPNSIPLESKSYNELKAIKQAKISDEPDIANISFVDRRRVVKLLLESGCIKNINDRTDAGETALFLACTQGYTEILEILYKAGCDITLANNVGCSPLSTAVIHGNLGTVKWLLNCPQVDIDGTDYAGCTPLYRAAEFNRLEYVKVLLDEGCDLNITDNELVSALVIACKSYHTDIVVAIFEHCKTLCQNEHEKAIVSKRCLFNKKGVSVLDFACECGDHGIVKFLLDQGIDPTTADVNGNTALHRACMHLRLENVVELLKRLRDVNVVNRQGESPLMMIPYNLSKVTSQEDKILKLVKHLIVAGANLNLGDYRGYTPLFRACEANSISVASILLDHGAHIDTRDKLGRSLLHAVVTSTTDLPYQPMMDWIIVHGVGAKQQDSSGMTALHLAVIGDNREVSSYLVSRQSDLLVPDKFGISPVCHMTKFPNTFRLFMPQLKKICSTEMAMKCCRFSYWWRTFSERGIKKELTELYGDLDDLPTGLQVPSEKLSTTVSELECWKNRHFHNDAHSLYDLLKMYGRVTETDMAKTVIGHLDTFISAVAEQISPNAAFTPVKAGSLSEGTKAMQPDEGDYILQQRVLSIRDFDLPENYTIVADFGRLRFKKEHVSKIKKQHPHLITELNGSGEFYLDRDGLFQNSYQHVSKVLNEPEFWEQFPMFCRLSCKDVCPDDVTIRHLDLIYSDDNYAWMPLDVDMVPAIYSPHWHPPWCRQDEFCQRFLRKNGCRFIAKWAIGAHEDPTLFRISFEKCEKELFHTMPMSFKKAYQLGKILKSLSPKVLKSTDETNCEKIEKFQWLEGISSFITSYHMKTTIFGMYEEYFDEEPHHLPQSREFDIDQVILYTRQMFMRLTESYKTQNLRNFWLPGENLLIDAKYGQYGWCASNYARLLQWLLETGTEMPQFLMSAEDTQPTARSQCN